MSRPKHWILGKVALVSQPPRQSNAVKIRQSRLSHTCKIVLHIYIYICILTKVAKCPMRNLEFVPIGILKPYSCLHFKCAAWIVVGPKGADRQTDILKMFSMCSARQIGQTHSKIIWRKAAPAPQVHILHFNGCSRGIDEHQLRTRLPFSFTLFNAMVKPEPLLWQTISMIGWLSWPFCELRRRPGQTSVFWWMYAGADTNETHYHFHWPPTLTSHWHTGTKQVHHNEGGGQRCLASMDSHLEQWPQQVPRPSQYTVHPWFPWQLLSQLVLHCCTGALNSGFQTHFFEESASSSTTV